MNVRSRIVRTLAALIVGAAGGTVVSAGAAHAAACPSGTGVTVVVNSSVRCDANGGGAAASNFARAGHSLNSSRGFVCDIDGYPSRAPCRGTAPPDAYWGLFSANGTGGGWNYASQGAYSLSVPKGGWVAFKFQNSSSRSYPGMRPYTAPAPKPKPKPTPKAAAAPKPRLSTSAEKKKATPSPSASGTPSKSSTSSSAAPSPSASVSGTAAAAAREEALQRTSQQSDSSSTSTLWVGSLLALGLLIGMVVTIWQRRARRS
ncbi:MAG: hypothetical protein WCB95_02030 [Aeromicrobium sp.]